MQIEKKNGCFPNLDKHLRERGRKLVSYKEGAEIYGIPYYSFVRLGKEGGANYTLRKSVVIDIDIIEQFLDDNPDVAMRVVSVRKV